ncbi:hypothetical protein D7030_07070 [Flavobacteriaceae bacterium AU392]|nr:hypothetical protein D1817_01350 [Flavobacteriaceae bacterium]RKM84889.1 hypothetical protein D7030_07070 [Flavobacteriaceae bacterium AU392]
MKLNQEEIKFIDDYFIKNGIKYWDIRMEMVDHIASDIEENFGINKNFYSAFDSSIEKLGWEGDYLKDIQILRLKAINKNMRRQYFKEFANIFKNTNTLIVSVLGILFYWYVYARLNTSIFKIISLVLFFTPAVIYVLNFFLIFLKKAYKSGNLLYSSFYVFFSFLMLNMVVQFSQPEGAFQVTLATQKTILFFVTIINTLFTYAGVKVHIHTMRKTKTIYKKLTS